MREQGFDSGRVTVATDQKEVASAQEVIQAMVKAAKGIRIYLPNNPVLIRFMHDLNARMTKHLSQFGDFRLEIEPFVMRYRCQVVYDNADPKESLAFRIHSDGIRLLSFASGLEERELQTFLSIVAFEQTTQADDDIVTQLWERNLPHIGYLLEEDLVEMAIEGGALPEGPQQGAISRALAYLRQEPVPPPRPIPKTFLALTRDDAAWLRKARQLEVTREPLEDVFTILFAVLGANRDPEIFGDFLSISGKLLGNLFLGAEIGRALKMIRFLDHLAGDPKLPPPLADQVRAVIDGVLSDTTVAALQEAIDAADSTVGYDEVRDLLMMLGVPSLGGICDLLGRVEKLKIRKLIVEVLVELGRARPEVFAPYLSDPRWYLVRNLVLVLSLVGTPKALAMIVGLISSKEPRIRREVLGFLERSPDPKAKHYLLKYLRDDSTALRIRALQIMARERLTFALKPAIALTQSDDFKLRPLDEKKAVYGLIGELGNDSLLPIFREMLLKKRWFQKAAQRENALLAVAGLRKMRSPGALELLEEGKHSRDPEVRELIAEALSSLSGSDESDPLEGEEV
ncbi:hypothetical protein GMSM_35490 [Geomonas sp. Red276]